MRCEDPPACRRQDPPRHAPHRARHGRRPRRPHPPRPDPSRPLLSLAVAKILRALALQESPGLLILGKQGGGSCKRICWFLGSARSDWDIHA
ncbi:hypothetical protein ZWY2020_047175 [Hordeum vulgare]|nr:hypothetical protein ZWY2020_047175 [Hordeum vulgare]